ncbi:response regulator transcription factor [Hymenobacter lutimineralis]|uniref:Response regulator transcription factor n=1 Tax=Hymenobacter lutimineralis TaxID=2606448 RepID=A0A5D6UYM4_9BACT|nr:MULTISPECIES: LytTR family DNA-binding domain-containing protein [Hymenobacter]QIX63274.1 response regulator transcription factor [Hymenobacter sp. BT18]TYZ08067.1 response regulator transcription factor [Hymenobacter lutimineralis]
MINCLIIDDEPFARELLQGYVAQMPGLHLVASCEHVFEALEVLRQQRIDLLFSDINMPQVNGLEFIRSLHNPPYVIFVTASPHHALEGYELDALDYVVKPVSFPRFMKAVNKALAVVGSRPPAPVAAAPQFLFVKEGHSLRRVLFEEIYYIEGMKDYIRLVLKNQMIITYLRMSRVEDQLPPSRFIRIQKSYIVRLDAIRAISGNEVELYDLPEKLPVGKQYKEALLAQFGL